MKAIASGMIAAAVTPLTRRRAASVASEWARAAAPAVAGGEQAGEGDHPVLAEPVADRTPEQLADAVGQREGGDGEPDRARRGRELARDRRHQRVHRADRGRRDEGRHGQERDRPGGERRAVAAPALAT